MKNKLPISPLKSVVIIISAVALLSLWPAYSNAQSDTTFSTPGSHSFIVPSGSVTVFIEAWGAGGGGGGIGGSTGKTGAGGGGGGGAYAAKTITLTAGTYTVVVGSGGGSQNNGGDSYFIDATTLVAGGGSAGQGKDDGTSGTGGTGGIAQFGDVNLNGGSGAAGSFNTYGGGGGSSAGTASVGAAGNTYQGGTAPSGGGNGGNGWQTTNGAGGTGGAPGGGGGGALKVSGNPGQSGGAGANGKVVITISNPPICPNATLVLSSLNGTDTQSVCLNTAITTITYTVGGGATGATVSGLPGGLTGGYSGGFVTISGTPNQTGVFNFSVTTTGTPAPCTDTTAYGIIRIHANPTVSVNSPSYCANSLPATITATPNPSGTYSYSWSVPVGETNPGNVASFGASTAGVYSVTVTDSNTCTGTGSGTLTIHPVPAPIFALNGNTFGSGYTEEFCYGENITLTFDQFLGGAGTLPLTIDYDVYIDGSVTPDATLSQTGVSITSVDQELFNSSSLAAGEYFIEVTSIVDSNGCSVTDPENVYFLTITVNPIPAPIFALNGNTFGSGYSEEFCYGENITLTFDQFLGGAGTLPLTIDYDVYIDGSATPDATLSQTGVSITSVDQELFNSSSLAAGQYFIEVTSIVDSNGCSVANPESVYYLTITIHPTPAPIFALNENTFGSGYTEEFCYGENITLTFDQFLGGAGTLPLTIDYDVYIDGSVTPDATLSQTGVSITSVDQELFNSSSLAAGEYFIEVTSIVDSNGCSVTDPENVYYLTITVNPIPAPIFALNGSAFGSGHAQEFCNGDTIILAFDQFLGGAGTLPLTIDFNVYLDGSLTPDATLSQAGVSIAAIGQELFNSPALAPGEYFIEVTSIVDSNGCSVTNPESVYYLTITIHPTPAPIFALNGNTFGSGYGEEFCYGENITLTFDQFLGSAGTLPLTIDYDVYIDGSATPDATLSQTGVSITAVDQELFNSSSLAAGEYFIELTSIVDSNGCSVKDPENVYYLTITVNPIPAPIFALNGSAFGSGHSQEFCDGDTITLAFEQFLGSAGTLPLTIDYNVYIDGSLTPDATLSQSAVSITAAGQVLFSSNALAPGEYYIEVTSIEDDNGCVVTNPESIYYLTIIVHDLPVVGLNIPWTRICNNETGVKLSGGTPAGGLYSGNGVFNGNFYPALVVPGTITITYTYTDTNQCSKPATDQVIVDSVPVVTLAAIADLCADAPSLTLSGGYPAGGTFSGPHVSAGVFNTAAAGPGSYTITYTWEDGMGCIGTATRPLIVHPLPVVNIAAPYEICMDAPPLTLTGATPVGGTWTGTGISGNAFDPATLAAGNYLLTYTYTDTNGCTSLDTASMTIHPLPVADAGQDDEICLGQCFQLSASGGLQYAWSNGVNTSSQQVCPVVTTTYIVTVTDQHGCQDTDDITITVYPVPAVVNEQHVVCSGDCIDLVAPLGTSFIWSTGETTKIKQACPTSNSAYIVTVTNEFGCATVSTYQVSVKPLPEVFAGSDKTICAGQPAILLATGATTYAWSTGATTPQITVTPMSQTTYTVTGTALNGCTATDQVVVNVNPLPVVGFSPASPEVCAGSCITLAANGGILYNWAHGPSSSQVSVCPTVTQTYTVSVTDSKGCTGTGQIQVNVNPLPVVYAGKDTSVFAGGSYVLDLAMASGTGALQYAWSPAVTLDNPSILHPSATPYASTTYTLLVTDSKGCKGSDQVLIDVFPVGNTVAGQVIYDNASQTPMPGFKIIVTSLSNKAADTIVAGPKGMFYLNNIPDGNYVISGTTAQNWGWGGVNATDALFSMRHFVELDTLKRVRLLAGDVNSSQQVNSSDALQIAQRFSGIIQSFVRGNWVMAPDTITLSGGTLFSKQFMVLCVGDVNGSYNPFLKSSPINGLVSSEEVRLAAGADIRIPVSIGSHASAGAMSLELIVPQGIEVQGAEMAPGVGGYLSAGKQDGNYRIAWFNPDGQYVTGQEPLFFLHLKTHSLPGTLRFGLGNEAEITDREGRELQQAVVDIPALKLLNMKDALNAQVYPNPMRDQSNLSFYLPFDGQLKVDLLNLLGEAVINITDGFRTAGEHHHVVDMSALPAGTYLIRWQYDSPSDRFTHHVKVVRLK